MNTTPMKTVVVSTNNNPDYLFFAPYIEKAWNKLGWKVAFMVTHDVDINELQVNSGYNYIIQLPKVEGLRIETVAQASRLYAAPFLPECLLMTSDIDLLPLQDYWKPHYMDKTIYGHDLTWRSYYPMGYIAMNTVAWRKHMNLTGNFEMDILRDAKETEIAYMPDWESWWNFDWDLITKRLKPFEKELTLIDRGQVNIAGTTLAKGRADRYNWDATVKQEDLIDAHCHNNNVLHPSKLEPFLELFEKHYGKL